MAMLRHIPQAAHGTAWTRNAPHAALGTALTRPSGSAQHCMDATLKRLAVCTWWLLVSGGCWYLVATERSCGSMHANLGACKRCMCGPCVCVCLLCQPGHAGACTCTYPACATACALHSLHVSLAVMRMRVAAQGMASPSSCASLPSTSYVSSCQTAW